MLLMYIAFKFFFKKKENFRGKSFISYERFSKWKYNGSLDNSRCTKKMYTCLKHRDWD